VSRERGGAEVGYRVRFEQKGGGSTRLWFVTEGVFSRRLARDPYLEDVGVVVLDEFHERHLQGDVALGVVRELQETVRPDLKLVVMSATLDTAKVAAFLDSAPLLTSEGRAHPVEIEHAREPSRARPSARVAAALARELRAAPGGDVLVFLPGAAAIRETAEVIAPLAAEYGVDVAVLHAICRSMPSGARSSAGRGGRSCSRPTSPRRRSRSRE
jgi:ATP-dependent RNA helicase HrpB